MIRLLAFFLFISCIFSCNDDLVTSTELQDTPIIYGLLSVSDTAQYIRVERAFLEEGTDANQLAQDPDRIYYDESVAVSLVEIGLTDERRFPLERVNGADEGYVRDDGPFVTDPNVLYKLSPDVYRIREDREYRIEVDRPGMDLVTSISPVVGTATISSPRATIPIENRTISINPSRGFTVALSTDIPNAAVYDYSIFVRLQESSQTSTEEKILEWIVATNVEESDFRADNGRGFYSMLSANLDVDPAVNRRISEVSVQVTAASQAFADFRDILQANSGITGAEDFPIFSNIEGGRGVFASRNTIVEGGYTPNSTTIDSLRSNELTAALNFSF